MLDFKPQGLFKKSFIITLFEKTDQKLVLRVSSGESKYLETMKVLGLRPRTFICFSVFGSPDETLALVFDLLLETLHLL